MKEDAKYWLSYASENLDAANVLMSSHLYNPCLQNVQQCVEKSLKAVFIQYSLKLRKSHSISELWNILKQNDIILDIDADERDLLDSIYLPSKYPVGSALPDYYPDENICRTCITMAERIYRQVFSIVSTAS